MSIAPTFRAWLLRNYVENDQHPFGDLARDIRDDDSALQPRRAKCFRSWYIYLRERDACQHAIATFREAHAEYCRLFDLQ